MMSPSSSDVTRDLGRALRRMDLEIGVAPAPRREKVERPCIQVIWSVRRPAGGPAFRYVYKASASTWKSTAERDAQRAIRDAGLIPWVWLETIMPE